MKVDFSQQLTNADGTPLRLIVNGEAIVVSGLKEVAMIALGQTFAGDETLPPQKKYQRGRLAFTIQRASEPVEMEAAEAEDLKGLIARTFSPIVVVQAFDIIEGRV